MHTRPFLKNRRRKRSSGSSSKATRMNCIHLGAIALQIYAHCT
jgi:hypothetical protein